MKLLYKYLKRQKLVLFGALLLASINQIFSLLDPQVFRLIIDNYVVKVAEIPHDIFFKGVGSLVFLFIVVAFISRVAKNFQDYFMHVITNRVGAKLYEDAIEHAFSLPYLAFEDQSSGELLQKLQKARTDVEKLLFSAINVIFLTLIGIAFVVSYAFWVNWVIGVIYLSLIPTISIVMMLLTRKIKAMQAEILTKTSALAGSTTETLRNVELVKSLGLERQEIERLNITNSTILDLELTKVRRIRLLSFIQGTFINAMRSGILFLMLYFISTGNMTFGEFMSLYIYSFFIFAPLQEIGNIATTYQEASASLAKVEDILKIEPLPKHNDAKNVGDIKKIYFDNVTFNYPNTINRPSLSDISLEVNSGTSVAFVGQSGAGKSTLIKLLVGLYQPSSGIIKFNGMNSNEVDYDEFRKKIGYVSQDTQLFSGTIRDNLKFIKPDATDEECIGVLKIASANSILERTGEGLDTIIGEAGLKLSGGERQRLAIARALLRDPDILVFDEATSNLDSLTEKEITDTIKALSSSGRILIMIAHRLSTVAHADMIYVLEKGRIIEKGNHENLLNEKGLYSALWRQQKIS